MGQYLSIPFLFLGLYLLVFSWRHGREAAPSLSHERPPTPKRPSQRKTHTQKRRKS
jgi:hypothetical protein